MGPTIKSHKHYKRWIELRPKSDASCFTMKPRHDYDERFLWEECPRVSESIEYVGEVSTRQFDVVYHEEPSENLKKLKDLGYKEGAACRILDTLGLE